MCDSIQEKHIFFKVLKANSKNYLSNSGSVSSLAFLYSLYQYSLVTYHVPHALLCCWDTAANKTDMVLVLMGFTFYWKRDHQQVNR